MTRIEARNKWYHIQFWSLPDLEFEYEVFANIEMASYARLVRNIDSYFLNLPLFFSHRHPVFKYRDELSF